MQQMAGRLARSVSSEQSALSIRMGDMLRRKSERSEEEQRAKDALAWQKWLAKSDCDGLSAMVPAAQSSASLMFEGEFAENVDCAWSTTALLSGFWRVSIENR